MRIFPFQVITAFLIAFIMPGLTLVHASSITVSEDITSDTIWEADTVFVDGTITIDRYSTLTIEPGTYVEFQGYYALNVSGKLVAVGSEAEPIIFTVFDTLGFSNLSQPDGAWHGLQFDNRFRTDTCILEFCIIEYGKAITGDFHNVRGGGIRALYDSKLMVSNCTIRNNYSLEGGGGIYMNTSTTTIITHNTIVNNSSRSRAGGLLAWDAKPVITHNIICNNYGTYGGGAVFQSCDAVLANNMIYNNEALSSGGGVYMSTTDLVSIHNTICYNKTYDSMSIGD